MLKARLDYMCQDLILSDISDEAVGEGVTVSDTGIITGMSDESVTEQLEQHHIAYDDEDAPRRRELLITRLKELNTWMHLKLELQYPGITPDSLYPDAHRNVADVLHFKMRVSERVIYELFSFPLKEKMPDAPARIARAAAALRANTKWSFFKTVWKKGKVRKELEPRGFSRRHAKTLMRELARDDDVNDVDGSLGAMPTHVMPELIPEGEARDAWLLALRTYDRTVAVMRKMPSLIMGDDGYEVALATDAYAMQQHGDILTGTFISLCSDSVITNYLRTLCAGHFREMMMNFGYLSYLSNDGVEAINGDMAIIYHKQGQRGGVCGAMRDKHGRYNGRRRVSHVEAIAMHSAREVLWVSGEATRVLGAFDDGAQERLTRTNCRRPCRKLCVGRRRIGRCGRAEARAVFAPDANVGDGGHHKRLAAAAVIFGEFREGNK